ncbi:hypothetical protein DXV75_16865 [Alteromonas aestuariivivens]|uniref:Polysaccharide biosynthesis protein n=1 Tax=Alteromonas aestuariivivens TaxID=1938339 RepID=A0A3D8M2Q3_9ALTE|nr:hypothetical protein [Alteromonas aestuariivivens]RDV23890.1 hypothetical protein DXV75_16865 [Alteromonas aestuariivivens]
MSRKGPQSVKYALLTFQVTAFLVPWLTVLYLSSQNDIQGVANYSFLLAMFAPLALVLASPSRNYLISSDRYTIEQAVALRLVLLIAGLVICLVIGVAFGLVTLALAIYLSKTTEFLFDLPLSQCLRRSKTRYLLYLAGMKLTSIFLAMLFAITTGSVEWALLLVSCLFTLVPLNSALFQGRIPRPLYQSLLQILPLSLSTLVFSLYFNIPRYLLGAYGYQGVLAIYTISAFLLAVLLVMNNAFCQSDLHRWRELFESRRFEELNGLLKRAYIRAVLLYCAFQVTQLPGLFDGFWRLHNNLQLQDESYPMIFRWVVLLAIGPLTFSFVNYLLVITQQHKVLLRLTILSAIGTGGLSWLAFQYMGFTLVLWVICASGMAHGAVCLHIYTRCVEREQDGL